MRRESSEVTAMAELAGTGNCGDTIGIDTPAAGLSGTGNCGGTFGMDPPEAGLSGTGNAGLSGAGNCDNTFVIDTPEAEPRTFIADGDEITSEIGWSTCRLDGATVNTRGLASVPSDACPERTTEPVVASTAGKVEDA